MNLQKTTHETVLVNGRLEPSDKLQPISSDTTIVYEVIRVFSGVPLFIESHIERMNKSLLIAGLPSVLDAYSVKVAIQELTTACSVQNQNLRINVWPSEKNLFWTAFFVESHYLDPLDYEKGARTGLLHMERENPNAKVWQNLLKDTAAKECENNGFFEVILVDSEGFISEGSRSNLFFTEGNTLVTAPDSKVLGGITRQKLLALITESGIPLIKREISAAMLESFDGAFLTGTSIHLLPVSQIDHWQRQSSEHPLIQSLMKRFEDHVKDYIKTYSF